MRNLINKIIKTINQQTHQ